MIDIKMEKTQCIEMCFSSVGLFWVILMSFHSPGAETALANTALDLLLLLLMEQWRWLCTENVQKVLHLIFGTLIQRYVCCIHLHLRASGWPGVGCDASFSARREKGRVQDTCGCNRSWNLCYRSTGMKRAWGWRRAPVNHLLSEVWMVRKTSSIFHWVQALPVISEHLSPTLPTPGPTLHPVLTPCVS